MQKVFYCPGRDETREENSIDGYNEINLHFKRSQCCLTFVPYDIPAAAVNVDLQDNMITFVPDGVFRHLSQCQTLHLNKNQISSIWQQTFTGLQHLENLFLQDNPISTISDKAFDSFYFIRVIWLSNTELTYVNPNLFVNLPRHPLNFSLSSRTDNWNCSSLCWLKHEEQHGTVVWGHSGLPPSCALGEDWEFLQCRNPGESLTL